MQLRATRLTAIASAVKRAIKAFSPAQLFGTGAPGVWYDPSDVKLDWRYNLLTRTEEFDNAIWVKNNLTSTPTKVTPNTATGFHHTSQPVTYVATGYTAVVEAKADGYQYLQILAGTTGATSYFEGVFNLSGAGSVEITSRNVNWTGTRSIELLPDGYYRCTITVNTASAATGSYQIGVFPTNNSDVQFAGNGTSGILVRKASLTTAADASKPYQRITDGIVDYFAAQPQPVLFQDSAGTTPVTAVEQPVGLMLDKSQGLVLGSELVTNGTFDSGITGWTAVNGSTTWTSGRLRTQNDGSNITQVSQALSVFAGKTYRIDIDVFYISGSAGVASSIRTSSDPSTSTLLAAGNTVTGVNGKISYYYLAASTGTVFIALRSGGTSSVYEWDNISVKELPGNHAFQSTSASRPVLSARYNLLTKTEQFDDAAWLKNAVTVAANAETAPDGTLTSDKLIATSATAFHSLQFPLGTIPNSTNCVVSISAKKAEYSQMYVGNGFGTRQARFDLNAGTVVSVTADTVATITPEANGFYRCAITFISTVNNTPQFTVDNGTGGQFAGNGTSGIYIWGASLVPANQSTLPYQRVNTSTDYNTVGFLPFLRFDGVDDSLSTNSISFTSTDKMSVFAGVRYTTFSTTQVLVELSASTALNDGSFFSYAQPFVSAFGSKGTAVQVVNSGLTAPVSVVQTAIGDISGDRATLRINGVQAAQNTGDQGTGNYGNYPLYIGRRNNASLPFNGQLYSMVIVGKAVTAGELSSTEMYVNSKTKAY